LSILLALSIIANVAMFLMLIGIVAVFATGQRGTLAQDVVREGPGRNRIALVSVQGIIHGPLADDVYRQLKAARQDRRVKGIIVRISSAWWDNLGQRPDLQRDLQDTARR